MFWKVHQGCASLLDTHKLNHKKVNERILLIPLMWHKNGSCWGFDYESVLKIYLWLPRNWLTTTLDIFGQVSARLLYKNCSFLPKKLLVTCGTCNRLLLIHTICGCLPEVLTLQESQKFLVTWDTWAQIILERKGFNTYMH